MATRDIVVIGASAGGVEALLALAKTLPGDFPAALLIVLHLPRHGNSVLPQLLTRAGSLPAHHPDPGAPEPLRRGHIYVAPPDHHMIVEDGHVRVNRGPNENGHRPAIDPLFRSAARCYGRRVIGVILSGSLDDGTAGMLAIKLRGGLTVVQDPESALYPSMPKSALENVEIDHIATLANLGPLLARLAHETLGPASSGSSQDSTDLELTHETGLAETHHAGLDSGSGEDAVSMGVPSGFACPDCHGTLWELREGELVRFRCRVGHAFLPQSLSAAISDQLDEALWIALRSLRENAALCGRLAERAQHRKMTELAANYQERADEAQQRASLIEEVLRRGKLRAFAPELSASLPLQSGNR